MSAAILVVGDTSDEMRVSGWDTATQQETLKRWVEKRFDTKEATVYVLQRNGVSSLVADTLKKVRTLIIPLEYKEDSCSKVFHTTDAECPDYPRAIFTHYNEKALLDIELQHLSDRVEEVHLITDKYRREGFVNNVSEFFKTKSNRTVHHYYQEINA